MLTTEQATSYLTMLCPRPGAVMDSQVREAALAALVEYMHDAEASGEMPHIPRWLAPHMVKPPETVGDGFSLAKGSVLVFMPDSAMQACDPVVECLRSLLAKTTEVRDRTQSFHWNVQGPFFVVLHDLFGDQYAELSEAVDAIAERLRQMGEPVDPRAGVDSDSEGYGDAASMVAALADDHDCLAECAERCASVADEAGDAATVDLASKRAAVHHKAAWFLRSTTGMSKAKGGHDAAAKVLREKREKKEATAARRRAK